MNLLNVIMSIVKQTSVYLNMYVFKLLCYDDACKIMKYSSTPEQTKTIHKLKGGAYTKTGRLSVEGWSLPG